MRGIWPRTFLLPRPAPAWRRFAGIRRLLLRERLWPCFGTVGWQGARMQIVSCRECGAPVNADDATCAQCGALQPGRAVIEAAGYVWESRGRWMGLPLVHVAFGHDETGRARTACGVIAIGQRAVGGVAIGILAGGFVSLGVVSMG